jgi:hypothetical protein
LSIQSFCMNLSELSSIMLLLSDCSSCTHTERKKESFSQQHHQRWVLDGSI